MASEAFPLASLNLIKLPTTMSLFENPFVMVIIPNTSVIMGFSRCYSKTKRIIYPTEGRPTMNFCISTANCPYLLSPFDNRTRRFACIAGLTPWVLKASLLAITFQYHSMQTV
jgi:hypothetical protein